MPSSPGAVVTISSGTGSSSLYVKDAGDARLSASSMHTERNAFIEPGELTLRRFHAMLFVT